MTSNTIYSVLDVHIFIPIKLTEDDESKSKHVTEVNGKLFY